MFIHNDFILASSSRSRKDMFKKIGLKFKSTPPLCNESLLKKNMLKIKKSPKTMSKELSKIKAKSITKNKILSIIRSVFLLNL